MLFLKIGWKSPVILLTCFLLIVSARFNRNNFVIERPLNDAAFYMANVQFLRGEKLTYVFKGPFNERMLVTALAAVLPFEPLTAINIANILFLLVAIYYLHNLLKSFNLPDKYQWYALYMFVVSFPTFYYSTIGYTDPGVLAMIFMGVYAIYSGKYLLFVLAMILGTMAKEGIILLVPVAIAYAYSRSDRKWFVTGIVSFLLFIGISACVKNNIADQVNTSFYWKPTLFRTYFNLSRIHFYISSVLSFGAPGILCLFFLATKKWELLKFWKTDLPLIVGVFISFLPWLYMIPSAYPDGRAFWTTSCFPIALSMVWWNRYGSPFSKTAIQ